MPERFEKILSESELDHGFVRVRHRKELFRTRDFTLDFGGTRYRVYVDSQFRIFGLRDTLRRVCKRGDIAIIEKKTDNLFVLRIRHA